MNFYVNGDFNCDVAIVGAGPTGLTIANLLGKAGVKVIVIERNPTTVQAPRAVSIDDEALRTMQAAGIVDKVLENVALDYGYQYITPAGVVFAQVEPTAREYGWPRRNAFTQPELEATLREGLTRFPNVKIIFETCCENVKEDADGVTIHIKCQDGEMRNVRARYLAATDGGRSAIRKLIGAQMTGSTYRERWLIVDLKDTKERFRLTRVLCNPKRPTICLPGPDGRRRYEFMVHKGETDEFICTPEKVRELLAMFGPDADTPIVRRQVYTFHARMADRWNTRRIFLGGDAAHLTPPFAGQGMNSGVRDAHNLAWKLTCVVKGELGPGLLDSYFKERSPHAWSLIEMAVNIGKVMMPTSRVQAFLVQTAFRLMRFIPPLHDYYVQMKYKPKPYYKDGFILPDDGGLNVVGRMQPQPLVERLDRSRVKFDELAGDGFALVAFGENAQTTLAACNGHDFGLPRLARIAVLPHSMNIDRTADPAILAVRSVDEFFEERLPKSREILLVIRPDRYAAAACDVTDVSKIADFAARVRALAASTGSVELASLEPAAQ
ncbi:MAG: bifunctional 3-(3-hydroxy-phenyl)propionate/3-hydroxycinnamic acid hydroxylase [Beijerinckiaceae bacterium]